MPQVQQLEPSFSMGILLNPSATKTWDTYEQYRKLQQLAKSPASSFTTDTIFNIDILNPLYSYTQAYVAATHAGTNSFTAFTFGQDCIITLVSMMGYYYSGTLTTLAPVFTIRRGTNIIARWSFAYCGATCTHETFSPRNLLVKKGDYVLVDEWRAMTNFRGDWRIDMTCLNVTP